MTTGAQMFAVVALTTNLHERGLPRGQVGTVVETISPGVYEVEFSDDAGNTYAQVALSEGDLIVLRYAPEPAG